MPGSSLHTYLHGLLAAVNKQKRSVIANPGKYVRVSVMTVLTLIASTALIVAWTDSLRADSQGANSPSTAVNDGGIGSTAWSNPGNSTASDNSRATATMSDGQISNYLKATDFGFSIPANSTINGIVVEVERSDAETNNRANINDSAVRIVKEGSVGSTDRSSGTAWPTTDAYATYGNSSDLWGESWTASDINSSNFGFAIAATTVRQSGPQNPSETARVDHIRITVHYTPPPMTLEQSAYRWFSNDNSTDVGSALAGQDTAATAPAKDTPFRLRMNLHVETSELSQSGETFKLQYAKKGAGSCASPDEAYADVATSSGAIQYYDNAAAADGAALTTNADDPQHSTHTTRAQTYEEANTFTNSQASIADGEDGMWDFALVDDSSEYNTNYCFRAVKDSGSATLNTYSVYPEITTAAAPTMSQSAYRWFEDGIKNVSSNIIDTYTNNEARSSSFQRRTIEDTSNGLYWVFYHNGSSIEYSNSTTGSSWTSRGTTGVNTNDFSIWHVADTDTIYMAYSDSGIKVQKGTLGSESISWGSPVAVNSDSSNKEVNISRDSNGKIWVVYTHSSSSSRMYVNQSTNVDDVSSWGSQTQIVANSSTNKYTYSTIVPLAGGKMLAVFDVDDWYTEYVLYNGSSWASFVDFPSGGDLSPVSVTADDSGNAHIIFAESYSGGEIHYYKFDGSSLSDLVTLDDNTGNTSPAITQTANGDIRAYWIRDNIVYSKVGSPPYDSGSWSTATTTIAEGTNAKLSVAFASTHIIPLIWREGSSSPYDLRFFGEAISMGVGDPLANQDTAATLTETGQEFRLRMNLHANDSKLIESGEDFKLQSAVKGTGTCSSPEAAYADVGGPPSSSGGPNSTGTAVSDSSISGDAWTSPGNVTTEDGATADVQGPGLSPDGYIASEYLKATNFGFSIPSETTIEGIEVEIKRYSSGAATVRDENVRIVKNGAISSTNFGNEDTWSTSNTYDSFGSSSELWGESWTPSDINSSNFGFALNAFIDDQTAAHIDHIRITVHHSGGSSASSVRYNTSGNDGIALIADANDPVHSGHTTHIQTYEEANDFTNSESAIPAGEDGMWDFALIDDGAPGNTTYCFRAVDSSGTALDSYGVYPEVTTFSEGGGGDDETTADIVDAAGDPVASPSFAMDAHTLSFSCESVGGTFGTSSQRIRVTNEFTAENWSLALAATDGTTATWSSGSFDYAFNDGTGSPTGCDNGQMSLDPSVGTVTPKSGCTNTEITKGSSGSFLEGTTDSLTILSGTTGTDTDCYWDLTGVNVSQQIPADQPTGSYNINMTLTLTAF